MIWMLHAKVHKDPGHRQDARDRIGDLRATAELLAEGLEIVRDDLPDQRLLVGEMLVDHRGGVFDALGDLAHRHGLVTVHREQLARRVEHPLAHALFVALAQPSRSRLPGYRCAVVVPVFQAFRIAPCHCIAYRLGRDDRFRIMVGQSKATSQHHQRSRASKLSPANE
jgi:hypothetical protein